MPKSDKRAPLFLKIVTPVLRAQKTQKLQPAPHNVFILSTGRTGTVYLADLINQLDEVLSVHEPKPSRVLNAWTTGYLEGHVSDDYMSSALHSKRKHILKNVDKSLYVESNNFIAGFVNAINQVFENPTIIHIARDPRDFATSLTNRGDDAGIRKFFNKFVPYWAYVPKGVKKRDLTPLTRAAYRWSAINQLLSDYGKNTDNYHFYKFEDLFGANKASEVTKLLKDIGLSDGQINKLDFSAKESESKKRFAILDRPADSTNKSKREEMPKWRDWTPEQKRQVDQICGPLMRQYGYGQEKEWLASLR